MLQQRKNFIRCTLYGGDILPKNFCFSTYRQRYEQSTGRDPFRCPHCGAEMEVWRIWHPTYGVIYDEGEVIKRGTYAASAPRAGP